MTKCPIKLLYWGEKLSYFTIWHLIRLILLGNFERRSLFPVRSIHRSNSGIWSPKLVLQEVTSYPFATPRLRVSGCFWNAFVVWLQKNRLGKTSFMLITRLYLIGLFFICWISPEISKLRHLAAWCKKYLSCDAGTAQAYFGSSF